MTQLQTTTVIAFGLAIVFIVWGKNTQVSNFFDNPASSITRERMSPAYTVELERNIRALELRLAELSSAQPENREAKTAERERWEQDKHHLHEQLRWFELELKKKKEELELALSQIPPEEFSEADSGWLANISEKAVAK